MASTTPPAAPLTTHPKPYHLDPSAKIALAIKLLQTKPQSLSISEFFTLLRSHTVPGVRALNDASERRHIQSCEFWRKRSEVDAEKVLELQAKVNELTGKIATLVESNKGNCQPQASSKSSGIVGQSQSGVPVKKKIRVANKKGDLGSSVKRTENQAGTNKKQQKQVVSESDQIGIPDEIFAPFPGAAVSDLISSLRLLQFTKEPHLVPKSITRVSQALCTVVQDFINGKLTKVAPRVYTTRGVAAAQTQGSKEIAGFSEIIEKTCTKAISTLKFLADNSQEGDEAIGMRNKGFLADGICGVIKMLTGFLLLIHKNTRALLSESLYPQHSSAKLVIRDIRLELTMILIRQLKTLNLDIKYQRDILEGTFYCFLEIINGILSLFFIRTSSEDSEDTVLLERLAVDETSWYFLRIFESVLQITDTSDTGGRKLEKVSMQRLKHLLIDGIFGNRTGDEQGGKGDGKRKRDSGEGFWGTLGAKRLSTDILIIESPFSRTLWELLGLDMLVD